MKICPKCNEEYDDKFVFCHQCGEKLQEKIELTFCQYCRKKVKIDGDYCPYCGNQLGINQNETYKVTNKSWLKNISCLFIVLFLVFFLSLYSHNDEIRFGFYDKGIISPITVEEKIDYADKLFKNEEYVKAFDLYKLVSEDSIASDFNRGWACFRLGVMYYEGYASVKNPAKALIYFNKSVNEFHTNVGYVGLAYYFDGEKDYAKAFDYLKTATLKKETIAYAWLGDYYREGKGVQQNYKEAFYWYKKATDSSHPSDSFYWLGFLCEKGLGTDKSKKEAMRWYHKGMRKGDKDCEKAFARLVPSLKFEEMK